MTLSGSCLAAAAAVGSMGKEVGMGKHQENSHGDKAAPMAPLAPTAPLLQGLQSLELSATKITRTRGLKGHYVHVSFLQAQGLKGGTEMSLGPDRRTGCTRSADTAVREPSQELADPQAQEEVREKPTMPRPNTEENSQCQFPWPG